MEKLDRIRKWLRGDTFVLKVWAWIFVEILERYTLIKLFRRSQPLKNSERFTDLWVLFNLFVAWLFWLLPSPFHGWWKLFLLYPGWRILGLVFYLFNVTLFHPYQQVKKGEGHYVRGYRRIVLLLLHNYIEILFWYAALYRNFNCISNNKFVSTDSTLGSLYFSLVTMSTLGYGEIHPINNWGLIFTISQTLIGIFLILLLLTRFIAFLPKPNTLDLLEQQENRRRTR